MIVNTEAIVLSRRDWREWDRLAVLLTEDFGRLTVRFIGVNRPAAKLRSLAEPLVRGEYRLYLSPRGEMAKVVGGQIQDTFPVIREDVPLMSRAMACLELALLLTAEAMPNAAKYRLLASALSALSRQAPSPWLPLAFGLKFLDLAGLKIPEQPAAPRERAVWRSLNEAQLGDFPPLAFDPELFARFQDLLRAGAEAQADRPLKAWSFMSRFSPVMEAAAA